MATEKIKIPVKQALPMVAEMIKFTYLASTFGKASSWIYNKLNCENTTTTSKGFNQSDIDILNNAIHQIGEELLKTRISNSEAENNDNFANRYNVVKQLKSLSKVASMSFIYVNKLDKNEMWYKNRISKPERYRFKEEELTLINMAIVEIGNKLLSIELTL